METQDYWQVVGAYGTVFTSPLGKQVLQDLERSNFYAQTTFAPGDPYLSAVNEGRRLAVLGIKRMIELSTRDRAEFETEFAPHTEE